MAPNNGSSTAEINTALRPRLSYAVAVLVLLVAGACALLILQPSPPFPPATPQVDGPTHTPPATFTPLPSPGATRGPPATHTPTPSPTPIVVSWRELGSLTVIEFTARAVADEKGERSIWGTDWVVLEVVGQVQMGVDMTRIRDSDVVVDGTSVEVVLPRPVVTSVELLLDQTRAYINRQRVLFSEFSELQIKALEEGQAKLRNRFTSDESWIALAEEMARRRLTQFLRQLGFEEIEIVFRETSRL